MLYKLAKYVCLATIWHIPSKVDLAATDGFLPSAKITDSPKFGFMGDRAVVCLSHCVTAVLSESCGGSPYQHIQSDGRIVFRLFTVAWDHDLAVRILWCRWEHKWFDSNGKFSIFTDLGQRKKSWEIEQLYRVCLLSKFANAAKECSSLIPLACRLPPIPKILNEVQMAPPW